MVEWSNVQSEAPIPKTEMDMLDTEAFKAQMILWMVGPDRTIAAGGGAHLGGQAKVSALIEEIRKLPSLPRTQVSSRPELSLHENVIRGLSWWYQ